MISNLNPGDLYILKDNSKYNEIIPKSKKIQIQICNGGDCAVFDISKQLWNFLFRITMSPPDLRRHWENIGNFPMDENCTDFAVYATYNQKIGSYALVSINDVSDMKDVSEQEYLKFEKIASWRTIHVLNRVMGVEYF
jgi:hypothetical protein